MNYLQDFQKRLVEFLSDCRPDMHEPDEQGVNCRVVGYHLDNAFGDSIFESAVANGYQEYVVVIEKDGDQECFNLANLIAIARKANPENLECFG